MGKNSQGKSLHKMAMLMAVFMAAATNLWSQEPLEGQEEQEVVDAAIEITQEAQELMESQGVEESPVPDAYVARAIFTTEVVNREPVDQVVSLDENATDVLFFTDLRNLQGRTVTHRWEFEGEVISEIDIEVRGPRWRAYSIKSLNPGQEGKWTVFVIDESGWPLHASIFQQRVSNSPIDNQSSDTDQVESAEPTY
jgi:hypothetical protein